MVLIDRQVMLGMVNKMATGPSRKAAMSYSHHVKWLHLGTQASNILQHKASVMKSGF